MGKLEPTPRYWTRFTTKPSAPPSGTIAVYARDDDKVYKQLSDGTETEMGAGGGSAARAFFLS